MLQRGVQDRYELGSVPEQLLHADRHRRRLLVHLRAREAG